MSFKWNKQYKLIKQKFGVKGDTRISLYHGTKGHLIENLTGTEFVSDVLDVMDFPDGPPFLFVELPNAGAGFSKPVSKIRSERGFDIIVVGINEAHGIMRDHHIYEEYGKYDDLEKAGIWPDLPFVSYFSLQIENL